MKNTFSIDTKVGSLNFTGIPTSNDFDYKSFAINNGFINLKIDSPENTEKYGGVGFVVYENHNDNKELSYHLKKRLEILFIDELPVMYKII
jgi:hypothetical protein